MNLLILNYKIILVLIYVFFKYNVITEILKNSFSMFWTLYTVKDDNLKIVFYMYIIHLHIREQINITIFINCQL